MCFFYRGFFGYKKNQNRYMYIKLENPDIYPAIKDSNTPLSLS